MIEQVNGKILPPFHERLQALVDEHGIKSMEEIKGLVSGVNFRIDLGRLYIRHNRDLVIDFLIESLPSDADSVRKLLNPLGTAIHAKILEDFEDHWYCGTNEEVVAAGTRGDVDPLEPAKDLAEMRAKDVIKEAWG